jgi:hypothetical protein
MRRVRLLCGLTLAGLVPLSGCGKSSADKAREAVTTLASWQATLRLLEAQEARGVVPRAYARQVRRAAEEERSQAAAKLGTAGSR